MACSPPGYSVHGISQVRILEWVAVSFSGDLLNSWIQPASCIGSWILHHWATWEAHTPWITYAFIPDLLVPGWNHSIYSHLNLTGNGKSEGWLLGISKLKWTAMGEFNSDDHFIYYCGQESLTRNGVATMVNKSPKCSTWMQSQKWQNDLCSFPRQTIQYHGNPSLCPNQ